MNSYKNCKPKVVFFLSRFPFPLEKGDKLRAFYQIRDLSKDFDLYLICTSDIVVEDKYYNELKSYCKEIHIFYLGKFYIYLRLIINTITKIPFQVAYFYSPSIKLKIEKLIDKIEPDHIFCQLIRSAEYVKNHHNCSKSIDIMDALSLGMQRRIKFSSIFLRILIKTEYKRLIEYEKYVFDYFENKFIISEEDRNYLHYSDKEKIFILQNGVSENFFSLREIENKDIDILFTGNMSYFPNIIAAKFIYDNLYSYFRKSNLKFVICGTNPSSSLKKNSNNNFKVTGWVDNITEYYSRAKIFIAPMFSGSGMQNKIIEAMASGIPCICTSIANKSIKATHQKEIFIADTKEEMISAIKLLLNDENFYKEMSLNAKNFIKENFNWSIINHTLYLKIQESIFNYNKIS